MSFQFNTLYITVLNKNKYPKDAVYTGYAVNFPGLPGRLWYYLSFKDNKCIFIIKENENSQITKKIIINSENYSQYLEKFQIVFKYLQVRNDLYFTAVDISNDVIEEGEELIEETFETSKKIFQFLIKFLIFILIFFLIYFIFKNRKSILKEIKKLKRKIK